MVLLCVFFFFFFKQKTAYEMRISDWSSDVCSSDLLQPLSSLDALAVDPHLAGPQQLLQPAMTERGEMPLEPAVEAQPGLVLGDCDGHEIGRASCRERVCQYVSISVVAGSLHKKNTKERRVHACIIINQRYT